MKISSEDVRNFKHRYSDENQLVVDIIQHQLYDKFAEVILDVGAGTGDITSRSLSAKRVIQLDVLNYPDDVSTHLHSRVVTDFFAYRCPPGQTIGTLFFSHVLQFLDDDPVRLNAKIQCLQPQRVITVTNLNDGFMGELLGWLDHNFLNANPEVYLEDFPRGYELEEKVTFTGQVVCPDFEILAEQVSYLVDSNPSRTELTALVNFLQGHISGPSFPINQTITVYKNHDR